MPEVRESAVPAADAGDLPAAARTLHDAYPAGPERDRAVRWLAWIAGQMGDRADLAWWEIPDWLGETRLRFARTLTGAVIVGIASGLGFAGYNGLNGLGAGVLAAMAAVFIGKRLRPGRLRRAPGPQALVPVRPRSRRDAAWLALAVATGVFLRQTLISLWARPVAGSPSASYRACRRSTAIDGLACLLAGLPVTMAGLVTGHLALVAVAALLAGFALLTALADGKLPALKQAELALLLRRGRRVSFHRLLEDAADRQVLAPAGAFYRFRDPAVQDYLRGRWQAAIDERTRRAAERKRRAAERAERIAAAAAGKHGPRAWLAGLLSGGTPVRSGSESIWAAGRPWRRSAGCCPSACQAGTPRPTSCSAAWAWS